MMQESIFEKAMFAETVGASWAERARRSWLTLTSFGLQALVVAALLIAPLLRPAGFPSFHQVSTPVSWGSPAPDRAPIRHSGGSGPALTPRPDTQITAPARIPSGPIHPIDDTPPIGQSGPYLPGSPSGDPIGVLHTFNDTVRTVLPAPPPVPAVRSVRLSHMSEGDLIRKVQPVYPPLARAARIQGSVLLQAVIGKQGAIENLKVLSGHPMLVQAALDAVRQWRYRPYILNGEPVEVETQITVHFSLAGS